MSIWNARLMSIIVYFVVKKFASKGWVLKVSHFRMNNITIFYIIVVILVMCEANKRITVLFGTKRKAQYHAGYHEELKKRYCHFGKVWKNPRGNPRAAGLKRHESNSKDCILFLASKELESLAQHMPNLSDIDARTLALWMVELSKVVSPQRVLSSM